MLRRSISVAVSLLMLLLLIPPYNVGYAATETLTVDFGSTIAPVTYIGSGFLQVDYKKIKDDSLVKELKPQRIRQGWAGGGAFNQYDKIASLGIPSQEIVLSDHRVKGLTWAESAAYNVKKAMDEGKEFIYDIFNEPDYNTSFFAETTYYTQWDLCYKAIKAVNPNAIIAGPSLSNYKKGRLLHFLDHCKENNTVPDIFTFHFVNLETIPQDIEAVRKYADSIGIGHLIKEYSIDENIWSDPWQSKSAGYIVKMFANAERARVRTIHSVWNDLEGQYLCGILSKPTQSKTSQWWAYKVYADMTGDIVKTTQSADYDAVACTDSKVKKAVVLLGSKYGDGGQSVKTVMNNIPSYLVNNGKVHVKVESILYSEADCKGLTFVSEADYPVSNNSISITKNVAARDALVLTLSNDSGKGPVPAPAPVPKPVSGKAFIEAGGMVVMEAENYISMTSRNSHKWAVDTKYKGYSGKGCMFAGPDNGTNILKDIGTTSPEMVYKINFSTTGTYYAWARLYSTDRKSDSVYVGLDGVLKDIWWPSTLNSYIWENNVQDRRLTVNIAKAGIHYININMMKDGCRIDKIILAKDPEFTPSGSGPAESAKK